MEKLLAEKITHYLTINSLIPSSMEKIYIYGFELLFSSITNTVIILIFGILVNQILVTLMFLFVFVTLRRSTGGYHADTYLKCKLCTISVYLTVIFLSMFSAIPGWLFFSLFFLGAAIIFLYTPVENPNKPLTDHQKYTHRLLALIFYFIFFVLGLLIISFHKTLGNCIFFTLSGVIALILISICQERR